MSKKDQKNISLKEFLKKMHNLKIYCMCLKDSYLQKVKNLDYIPVGLKNKDFSKDWLRDNTLENISDKNPFYGEYTFYYWYWKIF